MLKLCSRQPALVGSSPASGNAGGGTFRSFAHARPSALLLLPATQFGQPAERYGHLAFRARLSPANSLFNRLDTFVHELQKSRDFFSHWPHTLCQRIRLQEPSNQAHRKITRNNHTAADSPLALPGELLTGPISSSTNCWNGRDFNGYNKALVEFGKAITANHPEVPASHTNPVNTMVLNLVAKLKGIGAQLARKSVRSAHLSLFQTLGVETLSSISDRADKLQQAPPGNLDASPAAESSPVAAAAAPAAAPAPAPAPVGSDQADLALPKRLDLIRAIEAASQEDKEGVPDDSSSSGSPEEALEEAPEGDEGQDPSGAMEEDEGDEDEEYVDCKDDCAELASRLGQTASNTNSLEFPPTPLEPDLPALTQPPDSHHQHHHHPHSGYQQQLATLPSSPLPAASPALDTSDTGPPGTHFNRPQINLGRPLVVVSPFNTPVESPYDPIKGNHIYPQPENDLIMMPPEFNLRQSSGASSNQLLQFGPILLLALIAFTLLVTTLCLRPKAIRLMQSTNRCC